jgi:hypothetical protein
MSRIESFVVSSRQCAELFRLGRDVEAVLAMVELFEQLMPLFAQAQQSSQQCWTQLLMRMLGCQEAQNWLGLADYLEYELVELLGGPA